MNDEHFRQVRAIIDESSRLAADLTEKLGYDNAIDPLFKECNKLWLAQFPPNKGWGKRLHLDLSGADFSGALFACGVGSLAGTNFRDARLDRTRWLLVRFDRADFTNASLRNSKFTLCFASGTAFRGADLREAHINISSGEASDFTGADLRKSELTLGMVTPPLPTHFFDAKLLLTGANMEGCSVSVFRSKFESNTERVRGEQLHAFLQSLSDEQRQQVTLTEPGLQPVQPSKGTCFIATAVYGSALTPQVQLLQQFRLECLEPHWLGRLFVRAYYQVSPSLAGWIRDRPRVRRVVRRLLDGVVVVVAGRS